MPTRSPDGAIFMRRRPPRAMRYLCVAALTAATALAQTDPAMRAILERLDRLEAENRTLAAEVAALRTELAAARGGEAPSAPTLEERVTVQEARTAEQAQAKVDASERFPLRITGMALFNAYLNSDNSGTAAFPVAASPGNASGGATFRQTVLGLDYNGPSTLWDGKVTGSLRLDLFGGSGRLLDQEMRLRTASLSVDWKSRSVMAGLEKPLVAQRDPESLAQVGLTALTGAGNLWLWLPQVRFQQTLDFGNQAGVRAQVAVVQTREGAGVYVGPNGLATGPTPASLTFVEGARPGLEARLEFFSGTDRRVEVAPGFHRSVTHAAAGRAPADIYTLDWLARPAGPIEFTGSVFTGTNTATLGGLQQGFAIMYAGRIAAVHSSGGWGQLTWRAGPRLWFNLFAGEEDPRGSQLRAGATGHNLAYGANVFYRLAPNVIGSLEAYRYRTSYIGAAALLVNHYDLAFAYRF